ncbi:MAG: hypothetical protein PHE18_04300, partial [Candidatus Omnitrophica bacterium]|nr:hypothetical protein [Candidatus Omnitrophota bacterium]
PIFYDKEHSVIGMTPGIGGMKNKLFYANSFNKHILGGKNEIGKEFFSADNYLVDLQPLLTKEFYEKTSDVNEIRLVSLFAIKNTTPETEVIINSEDVLKSMENLGYRISGGEIVSAKLELKIEGGKKPVPVRLTRRSTSQLNKTKEREIVENFLRTREVIPF